LRSSCPLLHNLFPYPSSLSYSCLTHTARPASLSPQPYIATCS
jgi:hypothetical protein